MRWRQSFMAEVAETLEHLGLKACPVCGSAESLSMGPFPTLLVDGDFRPDADDLSPEKQRGGDLTFAVRVECTTCGHLMLFNAQSYRTGDDKIMEATSDEKRQLGE
jgi:formate dehydrogenase maturation protein FdhE